MKIPSTLPLLNCSPPCSPPCNSQLSHFRKNLQHFQLTRQFVQLTLCRCHEFVTILNSNLDISYFHAVQCKEHFFLRSQIRSVPCLLLYKSCSKIPLFQNKLKCNISNTKQDSLRFRFYSANVSRHCRLQRATETHCIRLLFLPQK